MRGGSLPLLAWGALLVLSLATCWVWTDDALQTAEFGFAVTMIWGLGILLALRSRRLSLRRGAPEAAESTEAVPSASFGAFLVGLSVACVAYGFAFGRFLIYFGGGLLIAALGLVVIERRGESRARREWSHPGDAGAPETEPS